VESIAVRIVLTPRLFADLIAASLIRPPLTQWETGDTPALVAVIDAGAAADAGSRVVIALGDRLGDEISVVVDGARLEVAPTPPARLHDLVVSLAAPREQRTVAHHDDAESTGASSIACNLPNSEPIVS
jgi:hypothetical protein